MQIRTPAYRTLLLLAASCRVVAAQTPTQADTVKFSAVSAGNNHTCGLTPAHDAYCWGRNTRGQIGDGSDTNRFRPRPVVVSNGARFVAVSAGAYHTCGVTAAGAVYCWGGNYYAQLGTGDTISQKIPVHVASDAHFVSVSAGFGHSCGLTTDSTAYCWGHNRFGQLGDSSPTTRTTPARVAAALRFAALAVGGFHTCGLTAAGAAYCWGANPDGQLGDSSTTIRPSPAPVKGGISFSALSAGFRHTCGLTATGILYCWGQNDHGQVGDGSTVNRTAPVRVTGDVNYSAVTAGGSHSCGITAAGVAYCWGGNHSGQLGDGTTTDRGKPAAVARGVSFAALEAGEAHTCGVTAAGAAWCWGSNLGQLGDGTQDDRLTPVSVSTAPDAGAVTLDRKSTPTGNPLEQLAGHWALEAFVMGAGQFGGPTCGKGRVTGGAPVTIAVDEGAIALGVSCDNSSHYTMLLRYDSTARSYLLTVHSRPGINVDDLPVTYTDGSGLAGKTRPAGGWRDRVGFGIRGSHRGATVDRLDDRRAADGRRRPFGRSQAAVFPDGPHEG